MATHIRTDLPEDRESWTFGQLLKWHFFVHGTRPKGNPGDKAGRIWIPSKAADALGISDRQLSNYLNDKSVPTTCDNIEAVLFGDSTLFDEQRVELRTKRQQFVENRRSAAAPTEGDQPPPTAHDAETDIRMAATRPTGDRSQAESAEPGAPGSMANARISEIFGNNNHSSTVNVTINVAEVRNESSEVKVAHLSGGAGAAVRETAPSQVRSTGRLLRYGAAYASIIAVGIFASPTWLNREPAAKSTPPGETTLLHGLTSPSGAGIIVELPKPDSNLGISLQPSGTDPSAARAAQPSPPPPADNHQVSRRPPAALDRIPEEEGTAAVPNSPSAQPEQRVGGPRLLPAGTPESRMRDFDENQIRKKNDAEEQDRRSLFHKISLQDDNEQRLTVARDRNLAGIGFTVQEYATVGRGEVDLGFVTTDTIFDCAESCLAAGCSTFAYFRSPGSPVGYGSTCRRYRGNVKLVPNADYTVGSLIQSASVRPSPMHQESNRSAQSPAHQPQFEQAAVPGDIAQCANGVFKVSGFRIFCNRITGGGDSSKMGQVRFQVNNINECAERCRPVPKCQAFTYAASDIGLHQCQLFGPGYTMRETPGWVSGAR